MPEKLFVAQLQYTTKIGEQRDEIDKTDVATGTSFGSEKTTTQTLRHAETSKIKYDLVGKVAQGTLLTRRTAAAILKGISSSKLIMFRYNPEEFISKVIKLINEQKATMIKQGLFCVPENYRELTEAISSRGWMKTRKGVMCILGIWTIYGKRKSK